MTKRDLFIFLFKWQRLILGLTIFIIAMTTTLICIQPQPYEASAMLVVERNRAPVMRSSFAPGLESAEVQNTVSAIITTRAVMQHVVEELKLDQRRKKPSMFNDLVQNFKEKLVNLGLLNKVSDKEKWVIHLLNRVKTTVEINSNIITILYSNTDPALAKAIVNSVTDRFIDLHLRVYSPGGSESLKNQYLSLKSDYEAKVKTLEDFRSNTQASALEYRRPELVRLLGNLEEWNASASASAAELKQRYDSGHTELKALQARIAQYTKSIKETQLELRELDLKSSQLSKLQLEVDASEDLYSQYKRRYEQTRLDQEGVSREMVNVRVVEYAALPAKPNHSRLFFIIISAVGAMIFSLGIALLLQYFDNRIQDPLVAEQAIGLPVLASLEKV